jgi:nitrate/nitrite transporter NarK
VRAAHGSVSPRYLRIAVAAGCSLGIAGGWNIANVGATAGELAQAYGVGLAAIGTLTTVLFAAHSLLLIPGGRIVDRLGPRRAGVTSLLLLSVGNAGALVAADLELALALRLITGVGMGLTFVAGTTFVHLAGGSPFAQGLFGGMGVASGGLALAIVPQVEALAGWRAPYMSALLVCLVAFLVVLSAPRDMPERDESPVPLGELIRDDRLRRLAVVQTASFGCSVVLGNWAVSFLVRHAEHDAKLAGAIGAGTLVLGAVGRPVGGWLAREAPRSVSLLVASGLIAGSLGTLVLASATAVAISALACAVIGLAAGLPFGPVLHTAGRAQPRALGTASGFVNVFVGLVVAIGTPLVGLTFSLPGEGRIGLLAIAGLWAFAVLAVPGAFERTPNRLRRTARGADA